MGRSNNIWCFSLQTADDNGDAHRGRQWVFHVPAYRKRAEPDGHRRQPWHFTPPQIMRFTSIHEIEGQATAVVQDSPP